MSYIAKIVNYFHQIIVPKFQSKQFKSCQNIKQYKLIQFYERRKSLPKDYAQQILDNDILFVLSQYTNNEALKNLIQLYMQGVEHFKERNDIASEYFQFKLKGIFTNPVILTSSQQTTKEHSKQSDTPPKKKKFEVSKISVQEPPSLQKPAASANIVRARESFSFSFQEPAKESAADKFFQTPAVHIPSIEIQKQDMNEQYYSDDDDKSLSQQDERKENMILQVKQEMFIMDESKEAKEIIDKFEGEKERITKIIEIDIVKQSDKLKKRLERRQTISNISAHMNRTHSQPTLKPERQTSPKGIHQFAIEEKSIPEDLNELLSSKLPSAEKIKEVQSFQFNEND